MTTGSFLNSCPYNAQEDSMPNPNRRAHTPKNIEKQTQRSIPMHDKHIRILAVVATIAAICMYTSYIFQIQENLAGNKASPSSRSAPQSTVRSGSFTGYSRRHATCLSPLLTPPALFSASLPASPVSKSVQGSLIYIHIERSGVCKWGVGLASPRRRSGIYA